MVKWVRERQIMIHSWNINNREWRSFHVARKHEPPHRSMIHIHSWVKRKLILWIFPALSLSLQKYKCIYIKMWRRWWWWQYYVYTHLYLKAREFTKKRWNCLLFPDVHSEYHSHPHRLKHTNKARIAYSVKRQ